MMGLILQKELMKGEIMEERKIFFNFRAYENIKQAEDKLKKKK